MMFEINRRPGAKPPGRVTGWPTQQKTGRQPPRANRQPQRSAGKMPVQNRPGTATRKPMQSFGRAPQGFPANTKRPSFGNTGTGKPFRTGTGYMQSPGINRTGAIGRPGNVAQSGQGVRRPSPGRSISRPQPPVVYQPVYNNRKSYIFDPVPAIPPKSYPDKDDNSLPNPDKVPGDFPDKAPCNCGHTGNGCTTLSGFALGSDELSEAHSQQLEVLASTIIEQRTRFVTVTGHTDAAGSEEDNMLLGIKRANKVLKELKNAIHRQKAWAETAVFFKTNTKGEAEPVSETDAALNRRVAVCLQ